MEYYDVDWRFSRLLGVVLYQMADVCWAIALVRHLMALYRLFGRISMGSYLSIQCAINGVGVSETLGFHGALYEKLEKAAWFLQNIGTVFEHQCPLTYEIGDPNIVIGETDRRFKAGGIKIHYLSDYANNDEFEAALLKHLRISPIAAVVHSFDSMAEIKGSKVYSPTEKELNEMSQNILPILKHAMIVSGSGVNAEKQAFFEFQDSGGPNRGSGGYVRFAKGMCLITSFVEIIMPGTTEGDKFESQDLKTRSEIGTRIPDIYGMITKANSEASPSAVGYQPTLASDIGALQERTTTSMKGSITSLEAIYVPADDSTAPGPVTAFAHLDAATTIVSRQEWDYEAAMKAFADGRKPGVKICVGGYDTSLFEDDIKKALIGHFISCGEIFSLVIPRHPVTDLVDRSCAFMVIFGEGAEEKALALDGSDLGGWNVSVVKVEEKQRTSEEEEAFNAVYYDKNRRFGISVTGYDTSLPEDDLKTALKREFASCGEILHVYIPRGDSIAYVYFSGEEAIARALELYGHESRCTMFGGQEAQARAAGRGEWKLVAMPLTNYASPLHVGGSPCFGYTIPPHVLEWTSKRTVD